MRNATIRPVLAAILALTAATACGSGAAAGRDTAGTDVLEAGDDAPGDEGIDPGPADVPRDPAPGDAPGDGNGDATGDATGDGADDVPAPGDAIDAAEEDGPAGDPGPADVPAPDAPEVDAAGVDVATDTDVPVTLPCPTFGEAQTIGAITSADLREASGLAASRAHPGVLWSHNDSGDTARVFAIRDDGTLLAIFPMVGATARDFEDISMGPWAGLDGDAVFVADTGDNGNSRSSVAIHVLAEPDPAASGTPVSVPVLATVTLAYPGGPVDCEAFFVDPVNGDFYLVAKEVTDEGTSRLFRKAAPHVSSTVPILLEEVARVPAILPTGADISSDGSLLVIRTYFGGVLFRRPPGSTVAQAVAAEPCELPSFPTEPQGEAIAILPDRSAYVTVSEYKGEGSQDLHRTPIE